MGKTITLPGAPGTGELYGKAVTGMLPGIGKPARVPADAPSPTPTTDSTTSASIPLRCRRIATRPVSASAPPCR